MDLRYEADQVTLQKVIFSATDHLNLKPPPLRSKNRKMGNCLSTNKHNDTHTPAHEPTKTADTLPNDEESPFCIPDKPQTGGSNTNSQAITLKVKHDSVPFDQSKYKKLGEDLYRMH